MTSNEVIQWARYNKRAATRIANALYRGERNKSTLMKLGGSADEKELEAVLQWAEKHPALTRSVIRKMAKELK